MGCSFTLCSEASEPEPHWPERKIAARDRSLSDELWENAQQAFGRPPVDQYSGGIQPENSNVHYGILCDNCGVTPIIGPRFMCTVCSHYDLCYKCKASGFHKHHKFSTLECPERNPAVFHISAQCDSCGEYPILGTRYKCLNCADYDLCARCKNTGVHNYHRFREF